ncbi:MAG: iron-sulfur cluster assembly accessory protein [Oligoflexia bacterium]|nr:iron-sulfur cluster assembly accessory protein [Oligoflexia bacterium]MBF0367095.1 iron-sulfur cluster assembly accessory protein [Oligoflexia bacterium]
MIQVTSKAMEVLSARNSAMAQTKKQLRMLVERGGCAGFQYSMVFDEERSGDEHIQSGGITFLVDKECAPYLEGVMIDYNDNLVGGGIEITNMQAPYSCDCGKSFSI